VVAVTVPGALAGAPSPRDVTRSSPIKPPTGRQMWVPAPGALAPTTRPAATASAANRKAQIEAERHRKLVKAYEAFLGCRPGSRTWYAAAEVVLRYGEAGAKKLAPVVEARYRTTMREYESAFAKAARKVFASRLVDWKKNGKAAAQVDEEIRAARKVLMDLAAKKNLSKADLVNKADPAMKTLEELVGLDRRAVLAADRSLAAKRIDAMKIWKLRARVRGDEPVDDAALAGLEQMLAMGATPISAASRTALEGNLTARKKLGGAEAEGIRELNRMRLLAGLEALAIDLALVEAARGHCQDMVKKGFFSHTSPVPGKKRFSDRARLAGTTASGENIAYGTTSPLGANKMWFHSPGHFKNMFGPHFRRMGLGYFDRRWTQMFGR